MVDGDQIMAILGLALRDSGALPNDTVVATVMSNQGFASAMEREGVHVVRTKVGDRYVLEGMRAGGHGLGGEQSGHVIMSEHATTGDGLLTALHVLERMAETGRSLAELASVMTRLPQVLVNVAGVDRSRVDTDADLAAAVAAGGGSPGRRGPGAAAPVRHRAAGARDGRGAERRARPAGRRPARRRRTHPSRP